MPDDLLELFAKEARADLNAQIEVSNGLDHTAGLLLAFASAVAAFSEAGSRWLPAGRICAVVAAFTGACALLIRPVAPDLPAIRRRALEDQADVEQVTRELIHRRLDDSQHVRRFNRLKSTLVHVAAGSLALAVLLIGLGAL